MHKKNIVSAVAAVCVGFACVPAAHAGFINEVPPPAPAAGPGVVVASVPGTALNVAPAASGQDAGASPNAAGKPDTKPTTVSSSRNGGRFGEIGFYPDDVAVARGRGRDIALSDMLLAVVPKGFHTDMGDADGTQVVTWSGGLPWDTVLANAISPLVSVGATIDWTQHTVVLRRIDAQAVLANADGNSKAAGALSSSASSDPSVPHIWTIRQGYPIGKELTGWAKTAGWNLVWQMPRDVVAPATSTFTGDFPTAATEVVRTLAENGALIHARIFDGNHTVVVQGPGVSPE
jgi:hypothetical protein